jgi:phosphoglycerol transferase
MSIVILAIALLFAMQRASGIFAANRRLGSLVAIALTLLVIWDQMPAAAPLAQRELTVFQVESDREFTEAMESRLPEGAMVFQIPIMSFPEAPVPGITPYEHFRPYLFSKNLRFSFGATKGDIERGWQAKLGGLGLEESLQLIKKQGFQAVYINRKGFSDKAEGMIKAFNGLGVAEKIDSKNRDLICFILPK